MTSPMKPSFCNNLPAHASGELAAAHLVMARAELKVLIAQAKPELFNRIKTDGLDAAIDAATQAGSAVATIRITSRAIPRQPGQSEATPHITVEQLFEGLKLDKLPVERKMDAAGEVAKLLPAELKADEFNVDVKRGKEEWQRKVGSNPNTGRPRYEKIQIDTVTIKVDVKGALNDLLKGLV